MPTKYPCGICKRPVAKNHKAIQCDQCQFWIHCKCNNTSNSEYNKLAEECSLWCCIRCINYTLPFSKISDEALRLNLSGKNIDDSTIKLFEPTYTENILQDIQSITLNTDDEDAVEEQLINQNKCKYHSLSNLNYTKNVENSISMLHLNIASLNLHYHELETLLKNSNIKFTFIGITETGLKNSTPSLSLNDYSHIDNFTSSIRGGTRLYISKNRNFIPRRDLTIHKKGELESMFVEIINDKGKNFIIDCIYKHPSMSIDCFNILYRNTLEKITLENKEIYLMGDYNIDLLNTQHTH